MAEKKTNAMRILDQQKIPYIMHSYDHNDGKIDGVSVAAKINKRPEQVYKTLVAQGTSKQLSVFIIEVESELDLKKAAKAAGEKKLEMIAVKDIQKHTGYIRGGCSPLGMKKQYQTFIDSKAQYLETIVVSAGKIGSQMELSPADLQKAAGATYAELLK